MPNPYMNMLCCMPLSERNIQWRSQEVEVEGQNRKISSLPCHMPPVATPLETSRA